MKELKDRKDLKVLKDHPVKMVYPAEMVPGETQVRSFMFSLRSPTLLSSSLW